MGDFMHCRPFLQLLRSTSVSKTWTDVCSKYTAVYGRIYADARQTRVPHSKPQCSQPPCTRVVCTVEVLPGCHFVLSDHCIMEGINTELLIDEVKKREAIWNSSSETYKDRVLKKNQWSQLCSIFCSNFEDQTPKEKAASCKLLHNHHTTQNLPTVEILSVKLVMNPSLLCRRLRRLHPLRRIWRIAPGTLKVLLVVLICQV
ncbi:hypothetical protein J6590_080461 [Homalodisca vitripennis]|nr:hypothetical protein J6590_080461 [Homalodisca vitripennis]